MGAYVIREMKIEDIPGVLRIEEASFPTPWTEWMFRAQLGLGDMSVNLVLVEDGEVTGYATAVAALDEMHLLSIAVFPGKRRRGYGSAILEEVISRGRAKGNRCVFLEVRERNGAAKVFYANAGFRVIGRRKGYYIDTGEDAIVMQLDLDREGDGRSQG